MTGFLLRLATHALAPPRAVRPRLRSMFEPEPGASGEGIGELDAVREAPRLVPRPAESRRVDVPREEDVEQQRPAAEARQEPVVEKRAAPSTTAAEPAPPQEDAPPRRFETRRRAARSLPKPVIGTSDEDGGAGPRKPIDVAARTSPTTGGRHDLRETPDDARVARSEREPGEHPLEEAHTVIVTPASERVTVVRERVTELAFPKSARRGQLEPGSTLPATAVAAASAGAPGSRTRGEGVRSAGPARESASDPEPDIHVTIGRIEVRGSGPAAPPAPPPAPRESSALELATYLRERSEGQRP